MGGSPTDTRSSLANSIISGIVRGASLNVLVGVTPRLAIDIPGFVAQSLCCHDTVQSHRAIRDFGSDEELSSPQSIHKDILMLLLPISVSDTCCGYEWRCLGTGWWGVSDEQTWWWLRLLIDGSWWLVMVNDFCLAFIGYGDCPAFIGYSHQVKAFW